MNGSNFDPKACFTYCVQSCTVVCCLSVEVANQIAVWSHDQLFVSSFISCRSSDNWSLRECWLGSSSCFCLWLGSWNQFGIHSTQLHHSNDTLLCLCLAEGVCHSGVMQVPHPLVTSQVWSHVHHIPQYRTICVSCQ